MSRIAALVPFLLLLLPAAASAGTQENPELLDPSGDVAVSYGQVPSLRENRDAIDILAGWISENAAHVAFQIRIVDLATWNSQAVPGEIYFWQFFFSIQRFPIVYSAAASYQQDQWHYTLWFYDQANKSHDYVIDGSVNFGTSVLSLNFPKTLLNLSAGMNLTNLVIQTTDVLPEGTARFNDHADARGDSRVFYRLEGHPGDSLDGQDANSGPGGDGSEFDNLAPTVSAGLAAIAAVAGFWVVRRRRGS